jgi:XTP/dITP diphosphohydrolase
VSERRTLLVATRNQGKLREMQTLLADLPRWEVVGLDDLGVEETPEDEAVEAHDTFRENALAKARHYAARAGVATVADDSGLMVDALGGEPGVRSKRFSGREDLSGMDLDRENVRLLLERLGDIPQESRTARFVCAAAFVDPEAGREEVVEERATGRILHEPEGAGGFGYDPVFHMRGVGTFASLSASEKNAVSHRGRALRAMREILAVA